MANVSVTAGDVLEQTGAGTYDGTAGEDLTAGQTVYQKDADSEFYKADCDATAVGSNSEINAVNGIALNTAANGQPVSVQRTGTVDIGGTVVVGTIYVQSATAGVIAPWADLVATDYVVMIGVAITATNIQLAIKSFGIQIPA